MARRIKVSKGTTYKSPRKPALKKVPALTPIDPPFRAPFGSYDPGLDAAERATNRGLADLTADVGKANDRGFVDYNLATGDVDRSRDEALQDLAGQAYRFSRDLGVQRQQAGENYTRSIEGLDRNYGQVANRQAQQMRQQGAPVQGGVLAQQIAKRDANKAWDRQPIDTNYQRQQQDFNTREGDFTLASQTQDRRIRDNATRQQGRLVLGVGRDLEDRGTQLTRAQREAREFGLDTQDARIAQVKQTAPDYFSQWLKQRRKAGIRNPLGVR